MTVKEEFLSKLVEEDTDVLDIMAMVQPLFTDPDVVAAFKQKHGIDMENVTDQYHTFKELYDHRAVLFSIVCDSYKEYAWKSQRHSDGEIWEGLFVVGLSIPEVGDYSYHYGLDKWDMFDVKELEYAPEYDGHQPSDIDRLFKLKKIKDIRSITTKNDPALKFLDDRTRTVARGKVRVYTACDIE